MTSLFETLTLSSEVQSIRHAAEFIVRSSRTMAPAAASHPLFETAVVEALTNAFKHGNKVGRADASIVCEVELVGQRLTVRVLDDGPGFTLPDAVEPGPAYDADNVADIPEQGFGLSIIRSVFPIVRTIRREGRFGLEMARSTASTE
jgi:anti-sigma regulatory factor (Ser/Thr protein kinase)